MELELLKSMLVQEEDKREKPYIDSVGKVTIGVGRNLTDKGLSDKEIDYLLMNDIADVNKELSSNPIYLELDSMRQTVLADMAFNLGYSRLIKFNNMWSALKSKDYEKASKEMLDSKWAKQVGWRAIRLSKMMKDGKYYER